MQHEKEPTLASQGIRHFGIFRSHITRSEALLDKAILKALYRRWRHDGVAEGILAGYVETKKTDLIFQESIARLHVWQLIEFGPSPHQDARTVLLAPKGRFWAQELLSAVANENDFTPTRERGSQR
jgi:hypothetical protein